MLKMIPIFGMVGLGAILSLQPREEKTPGRYEEANRIAYANAEENAREYRRWELSRDALSQQREIATIITKNKLRQKFVHSERAEFRNIRWIGDVMTGEVRGLTSLGVMSGWRHFEING